MNHSSAAIDLLTFKIGAATMTAGTILGGFFIEGGNLPFFNVSISTLGMSAAGSMLAFAYGTPIESRKKLYGYAIGGTFIGIWGMQLLLWQGVGIDKEYRPPVAGGIALLSRWIVPFLIDNFPILWARIFGRATPPTGGGAP
jgi:hypothetical protein